MKRFLYSARNVAVTVSRYEPGVRQGRHVDEYSRVTILLSGACREQARDGEVTLRPGDALLKSRRTVHADEFGDAGATLVSLEFREYDPFDTATQAWAVRNDGVSLRHMTVMLEAAVVGDGETARVAGADLVAGLPASEARRSRAPAWLDRLRAELEEAGLASVNVAARAQAVGAHPAHASRLFRQCFGESITEYAQAQGVRRALAHLGDLDTPLSQVAVDAGFYDQSHMTRVFRRVIDRTPGEHRALLAGIG